MLLASNGKHRLKLVERVRTVSPIRRSEVAGVGGGVLSGVDGSVTE